MYKDYRDDICVFPMWKFFKDVSLLGRRLRDVFP